jgi:hypothetical protein
MCVRRSYKDSGQQRVALRFAPQTNACISKGKFIGQKDGILAVVDPPRFDVEKTVRVRGEIGGIGDEDHLHCANLEFGKQVSPDEDERSTAPGLKYIGIREMLSIYSAVRGGKGIQVRVPVCRDSIDEAGGFSGEDPISDSGAGINHCVCGASCDVTNRWFSEILDSNAGLAGCTKDLADVSFEAEFVHSMGLVFAGTVTEEENGGPPTGTKLSQCFWDKGATRHGEDVDETRDVVDVQLSHGGSRFTREESVVADNFFDVNLVNVSGMGQTFGGNRSMDERSFGKGTNVVLA